MQKLLLDTHIFIWLDMFPNKLSPQITKLLIDKSNILIMSVVSIWEMQIKSQLGKLQFKQPLSEMISSQQKINNINILPITLSHVLALQNLPDYHKDPFDRLLISQAIVEKMVLVSNDEMIRKYPIQVMS